MTIRDVLGIENEEPKLIRGKIFYVGKGYAFLESEVIPYKRIFLHWQNLDHNTLDFTELERGMELEFRAVETKNDKTGKMEWRAQKARVV